MFCSRCGKEVPEGNQFCQACGQEVGAAVMVAPAAGRVPAPPAPMATSAPVAPALPYAGFWLRFAAYLIDGVILGIPFGIVVIALLFAFGGFGLLLHRTSQVDPSAVPALIAPFIMMFWLAILLFVGAQWLYFAGMESSERQATFGKSAMSLRVTNSEGRRLSFGHATGRFFAKIVSGLIPFAIGYIMAGFTARKQALHDLIAGTLVLKK
jgi:uncharacterized RDD family membrane protein YckC